MIYVLLVVAVIAVCWVILVLSGCLSVVWSRRAPERRSALRLVMALVPLLFGGFLFRFHLRWTMNNWSMNLSRPFALPMALGLVALVYWFRARRSCRVRKEASPRELVS